MKEAAQRKKDKAADKAQLKRMRDEMAKDKAERLAAKHAKANGGGAAATASPAAAAAPAATAAPKQKKEYTTCKIQVRASGTKPITHTFQADDTIGAVFEHVRAQMPGAPPRFSLSMARPRKDYTDADSATSLKESGLMPSAALNLKVL